LCVCMSVCARASVRACIYIHTGRRCCEFQPEFVGRKRDAIHRGLMVRVLINLGLCVGGVGLSVFSCLQANNINLN